MLAAGCGNDIADGPSPVPAPATVALDFTPNAVHAPLYMAATDSRSAKPGSGPDSLKLVASGKVDLGVLDIHDLAIAREAGTDVVAVGALVGKPLAALIAQPDVRRPRELEGRTVGVSGLPSDPAFVRAIVEHDGGDFDSIQPGHDRLQRGQPAADQARRRRAGVLERRGRRAQAARPRRDASSASRTTVRRRIPEVVPDHVAGNAS